MTLPVTADLIDEAAARIRGHVLLTPCTESRTLSAVTGARVFVKFENLQYTGSFKDRGSCLKLQRLAQSPNPPAGVVAASATVAPAVTT